MLSITDYSKWAILAVLVSSITGAGCGSRPDQSYQGKSAPQLNTVKEVELETRSEKDGADKYQKSALFLTDYDRTMNHAVAVVQSVKPPGALDNIPTLAEVCVAKSKCGLTKVSMTPSLDALTAESVKHILGIQQFEPYSKLHSDAFTDSSTWLLSTETSYVDGAGKWKTLVAIELKDFKPNATKVKLRYKVLEYRPL